VLAGWLVLLPGIAQAAEIQVQIVTPAPGDTVGRSVMVEAQTTGSVTSVTFETSVDGGTTWALVRTDAEPSDGWSATWDAAGVNGPATVRATATDGGTSASSSVDVVVDTTPPGIEIRLTNPAFSPNDDGRADLTGFELHLTEPVVLTLRIEGPSGTVRLLRDAEPIPEGRTKVRWRGRPDVGRVVADGRYRVRVDGVDRVGNVTTASAVVVVDTQAPIVRWVSVRPEPYRGVRDVRLEFRSSDRSPILLASLALTDTAGRTLTRLGPLPFPGGTERFAWDGTRRDGPPAEPGLVTAQLWVRDDAGNVATALEPFRNHRPVPNTLLRRVEDAGGRIALTFDDCWNVSAWERILDVLEAKHAGGSFFCLGAFVGGAPGLASRTVEAGHTIGSHGWDHANVQALSPEAIRRRVRADADVWWRVAQVTPMPLFRPPGGAIDGGAQAVLGAEGFRYSVLWDVDPWDWTNPGPAAVTARVLAHARSGSIVVLHALDGTAQALPGLIDRLRARGLEPVTLAELLAR
jgi:peptidoglycan/xylan/chitin deacetylase (PgdA/CDA1 family)